MLSVLPSFIPPPSIPVKSLSKRRINRLPPQPDTVQLRFSAKFNAPKLKANKIHGVNLGYVGPNSQPLPMSSPKVFQLTEKEPSALPSVISAPFGNFAVVQHSQPLMGIKIAQWPVYAIALKIIPLQTSGMCRCSALCIQGPNNQHYMMHLNPIHNTDAVEAHLKRDIPWALTDDNTTISVIPGTDQETSFTVNMILEALFRVASQLVEKVQFRHFPNEGSAFGPNCDLDNPRSVVSYNNQLFCHSTRETTPRFITGGKPIQESIQPIST